MAKNKTITKKKPSKSTVGGSILKTKKLLNWKIIVPIIVLIALVGGFQVFRSFAVTYSFVNRSGEMNGGTGEEKVDGESYRVVAKGTTATVSTIASGSVLSNSSVVCFHYKFLGPSNPNHKAYISMTISYIGGPTYTDSGSLTAYYNTSDVGVCAPVSATHASKGASISVNIQNTNYEKIGIDTIFGRPR